MTSLNNPPCNSTRQEKNMPCKQVSNRQYLYEQKMLKTKSLMALGRKQAKIDEQKSNREKYIFNINSHLKSVNVDDVEQKIKQYLCTTRSCPPIIGELPYYFRLYKKLVMFQEEECVALKKNIMSLEYEISDCKDISDTFIEQLDQSDEENKILSNKIDELKSLMDVYHTRAQNAYMELRDSNSQIAELKKKHRVEMKKKDSSYNEIIFIIILTLGTLLILNVYSLLAP